MDEDGDGRPDPCLNKDATDIDVWPDVNFAPLSPGTKENTACARVPIGVGVFFEEEKKKKKAGAFFFFFIKTKTDW